MPAARTWFVDARIPVRFGGLADIGPDDALLLEGDASVPPGHAAERFVPAPAAHGAGCACCAPRSPAADALGRLFAARARGGRFFRRVLAVTTTPEGDLEVWAALRGDPLASARFREEVRP